MAELLPTIAVLGASGLIGEALAHSLGADGLAVVPIARNFTAAQRAAFGASAVESVIVDLSEDALRQLLVASKADVVVNCIGVLQDGPRGATDDVHHRFVLRLLKVLEGLGVLLIHFSIPGADDSDRTSFSLTKRAAERAIIAGPVAFAILRPGFVIAPAAYGGSALLRALACLPFDLSPREAEQRFSVTSTMDLARTVVFLVGRWRGGEYAWKAVWDVMAREPTTVRGVLHAFRKRTGGSQGALPLPSWLMSLGAGFGDFAGVLGWAPPIRRNALREMRRGIAGDPGAWCAATGIEPEPLERMLQRLPVTVQEKWYSRLYLAKALIIVTLIVFWDVSGAIALRAFDAAASVLTSHGYPSWEAQAVTLVSSIVDISVGLAIAWRRTTRAGLLAGIGVSLFYMLGAVVITPELWLEPLGALVKTGPAIVLMLVALAILDDR